MFRTCLRGAALSLVFLLAACDELQIWYEGPQIKENSKIDM